MVEPDSDRDFADWVAPHLPAMSRFAGRLVARSERDDVVQDALVRAWHRWSTFDPSRDTPSGWLLAILADHGRRTRSRRTGPIGDLRDSGATVELAPADLGLERAIARLTERQRLVVNLHHFVGLDVAACAEVARCAPGTVKATLHHARARLRDLLDEPPGPEDVSRDDSLNTSLNDSLNDWATTGSRDPVETCLTEYAGRWRAAQSAPLSVDPAGPETRSPWLAVAAVVVAVAAVIAGVKIAQLNNPVPDPSDRTSILVPWRPLPATHPEIPMRSTPARPDPAIAAAVAPCRAAQLRTSTDTGGAGGTRYMNVTITSATGDPCSLSGYPQVEPLTRGHDSGIPLARRTDDAVYRHPALVSSTSTGLLQLSWANWCAPPVTNDQIRITLADGAGTLLLTGFGVAPACEGLPATGKSAIGVDTFQPEHRSDPSVHTAYASVRASSNMMTTHALPGQRANFAVTLMATNRVVLDPCPDYTITLSGASLRVATYQLNCADVPFKTESGQPCLPPGTPVRFAMQVTAPLVTPQDFVWSLVLPENRQDVENVETSGVLTVDTVGIVGTVD
ncbi:MAG: polymerase, sigma-24 subunit, subfamily [Marmoricola sp.]|nr:polymerase, sigma-24 subunit, subfamily [Marmoricola sp.]